MDSDFTLKSAIGVILCVDLISDIVEVRYVVICFFLLGVEHKKGKYPRCLRPETNECDENARCIEMESNYRCECLQGYVDDSPPGSVPKRYVVL